MLCRNSEMTPLVPSRHMSYGWGMEVPLLCPHRRSCSYWFTPELSRTQPHVAIPPLLTGSYWLGLSPSPQSLSLTEQQLCLSNYKMVIIQGRHPALPSDDVECPIDWSHLSSERKRGDWLVHHVIPLVGCSWGQGVANLTYPLLDPISRTPLREERFDTPVWKGLTL